MQPDEAGPVQRREVPARLGDLVELQVLVGLWQASESYVASYLIFVGFPVMLAVRSQENRLQW